MKRKVLSMKKLYQYANDYLKDIIDECETGEEYKDKAEYEKEVIVKYLDYIFKNPK